MGKQGVEVIKVRRIYRTTPWNHEIYMLYTGIGLNNNHM